MIGDRTFREVIRTVTVSYPIPFLVVSLLAGGVALLGLYAAVQVWPVAFAGILSVMSAIGLAAFAVLRRPELLRSERHTLQQRLLDMIGDVDVNPEVRATVGKALTSSVQSMKSSEPGDRLSQIIGDKEDLNDD